jgi:multicomponent Na+:H+ antiporter subunit A
MNNMLTAVVSGFVLALFAPLLHRLARGYTGWLIALLPGGLFLYFATFLGPVSDGEVIHEVTAWVPALGVNLAFLLDGLSLMMALIITGIGALIFIYAAGYLPGSADEGRFYSFLLVFMAAMIGLVLSDNLLSLFVFWELTSISSYLLIGYKHYEDASRRAALQALVVTGAGGLALLAGFVLLGIAGGTFEISALAGQGEVLHASGLYLPILILVGLGAFTKSAQFPFHFWLPGAMAAPTPVSAYLHSATMVKAGVFLLARLSPALSGTDEWRLILTVVGLATLLIGGFLSLTQRDLKRILAYSTVSSLGLLVALLGWNTRIAAEAAMLFLLAHSLYKGALFMVAGTIDHETGTRDIHQLGGLLRVMPLVAAGALMAGLSMSGIPPFLGFISKEVVYEASLAYTPDNWELRAVEGVITAVEMVGNIIFVAVACLMFFVPFLGAQTQTPRKPHRPPLSLWLGPVLLGLVALVLALLTELPPLPDLVSVYLVGPAAGAVIGERVALKLHLIPSALVPMLWLSIATVAGGVGLYLGLPRLRPLLNRLDAGRRAGPERLFAAMIDGLPHFSHRVTMLFQSGYLRYYVRWIVGALVVLVGYTFVTRAALPVIMVDDEFRFFELALAVIILAAVLLVVRSTSLLFTIILLGVIGYSIALIFMLYGAVDLAMTQFSIETLSVVLFMLILYRLPDFVKYTSQQARIRDAVIAISAGGLVTALILAVTSRPLFSRLADYFAHASYPDAHGRNIVNVILVDFRGFDTLGEITVLTVAAIGVFALLRLRISDPQAGDTEQYEEMVSVEMRREQEREKEREA